MAGCAGALEPSDDVIEAPSKENAVTLAKQTLASSPNDPHANLVMAQHFIGLEKYRKAQPYARIAFDSGRLNAQAGRVLGLALWEVGRPIDTVDVWRVARAADPSAVGWPDYFFALCHAIKTAATFKDHKASLRLRLELKELLKADASRWPKKEEERELVRVFTSDEALEHIRLEMKKEAEEVARLEQRLDAVNAQLAREPKTSRLLYDKSRILLRLRRGKEGLAVLRQYAETPGDKTRRERLLDCKRLALGFSYEEYEYYKGLLEQR